MKNLFLVLAFMTVGCIHAKAQQTIYTDSLVYRPSDLVDSALVGVSVFKSLPASVSLYQPKSMETAMIDHISKTRTIQGYRVRIFFDNQQDARNASEIAQKKFEAMHHGITAYRSYQSPFFKVTVGDFRTRSEAVQLLNEIRGDFPSAFVVKENINYPVVDKNNSFVTDTVRVARIIR